MLATKHVDRNLTRRKLYGERVTETNCGERVTETNSGERVMETNSGISFYFTFLRRPAELLHLFSKALSTLLIHAHVLRCTASIFIHTHIITLFMHTPFNHALRSHPHTYHSSTCIIKHKTPFVYVYVYASTNTRRLRPTKTPESYHSRTSAVTIGQRRTNT